MSDLPHERMVFREPDIGDRDRYNNEAFAI